MFKIEFKEPNQPLKVDMETVYNIILLFFYPSESFVFYSYDRQNKEIKDIQTLVKIEGKILFWDNGFSLNLENLPINCIEIGYNDLIIHTTESDDIIKQVIRSI
jgi:hypothetical protein